MKKPDWSFKKSLWRFDDNTNLHLSLNKLTRKANFIDFYNE